SYSVPRESKDALTDALTQFIILNNRPFETVNGEGFTNLINIVLTIGCGLLD
ncbi:unnamed protein product, partial [Rotaria sordida]